MMNETEPHGEPEMAPPTTTLAKLTRQWRKPLRVYRHEGHILAFYDDATRLSKVLGLALQENDGLQQTAFPADDLTTRSAQLKKAGFELIIEDYTPPSAYQQTLMVVLTLLEERAPILTPEFYGYGEVELINTVLFNAVTQNLLYLTPEGYRLTGAGRMRQKEVQSLTPSVFVGSESLSQQDAGRLQMCESIIYEHLQSGLAAGAALWEIRAKKLYRNTHRRFEEYLWDRFRLSKQRAYQLMDAQKAISQMRERLPDVPLPVHWQLTAADLAAQDVAEAHGKELHHIDVEMRAAVFAIATQSAQRDENGAPVLTANHIRATRKILVDIVKSRSVEVDGTQHPLGELLTHQIMEEAHEGAQQWIAQKREREQRLRGLGGNLWGRATPLLKIFCTFHQQQPITHWLAENGLVLILGCGCEFGLNEQGEGRFMANKLVEKLMPSEDTPLG